MKALRYILTFSLVIITGTIGVSQEDFKNKTVETFTQGDVAAIKKSDVLIEENIDVFSMANTQYKSGNVKAGLKGFEKSTKIFEEQYRAEYEIFRKNLNKVKKKETNESKLKTIERLQEIAANYYRESISYRKSADLAEDIKEKCEFYVKAHESEVEAINNQSLAFAVYYSWTEYMNEGGLEIDFNIKDETIGYAENSYGIDPSSNRYSPFSKNVEYPTDIVALNNNSNNNANKNTYNETGVNANSNRYNNTASNNNTYNNNAYNKANNNNSGNYKNAKIVTTPGVTYKVQIASSNNPATKRELKRIMHKQENIIHERSLGMHKYVYGNYSSYPDAAAARDASGVKGAFIIVYKDGVRVISKAEQRALIPKIYHKPEAFYKNYKIAQIGDVEYRLQIGVSRIPASKQQIDALNPTDLEVKTYKSANFFKYTIGSFASYDEALNYRNANGLSATFVVKYKNGKEIR